jgi:hypothetical protein
MRLVIFFVFLTLCTIPSYATQVPVLAIERQDYLCYQPTLNQTCGLTTCQNTTCLKSTECCRMESAPCIKRTRHCTSEGGKSAIRSTSLYCNNWEDTTVPNALCNEHYTEWFYVVQEARNCTRLTAYYRDLDNQLQTRSTDCKVSTVCLDTFYLSYSGNLTLPDPSVPTPIKSGASFVVPSQVLLILLLVLPLSF